MLRYTLNAQIQPAFIHLTAKDGLSHNRIRSLFQDSKGFIWISSDGLNRYDGKIFKSFFHSENDSNSLAGNYVGNIVEDKNGNILMTCAEGICRFNPLQNRFKLVFVPDSRKSKNNGIMKILDDRKGHIWAITRFEAYELDSSFHIIKILKDEFYGMDILTDMLEDNQGNIWFDKNGSLNMYSTGANSVYNKFNNPGGKKIFVNDSINEFAFDALGNLWAIEHHSRLLKYNSAGDLLFSKKISNEFLTNILITPSKKIWLASASRGAFMYDEATETVVDYFHDEKDDRSLTNDDVSCILEDNLKNTWVGTVEGLNILPYRSCQLQIIENLTFHQKGISQNEIGDIRLLNHSLWIALWGKGLCRVDLKSGKKEIYETGKTDLDKCVWDVLPYNNEIWFGNFHGLHRFNMISKKISDFGTNATYTNDLNSLAFFNMLHDGRGNIWMSLADDNGIIRYNEKANSFERYTQRDTGEHYLPFRHYSAIAEDKDGRLWFGYNRSYGLATYDYNTKKFELLLHDGKPVFRETVHCLFADSIFLWLGTTNGLYKMNIYTYELKRYSRTEGLPNNYVHSIVKDNNGNLWIATDNGIAEFKPRTSSFINFNDEFDLPENDIENSLFDSSEHRLYITTKHTIFSFCIDSLEKKNKPLTPQITSFSIMGNETAMTSDSHVNLDYNDKYFSVEFTAPYFPSSKNIQYAFKLDGYDKDWIDCSNMQSARYTNIPFGNYLFRLKASGDGRHWDEMKTPLNIHIDIPFYLNTLFLVICAVALLSLFYSGTLIYYRVKMQQIKLAQKIRNKIAGDLHDDIGSTLSSINILTRSAKKRLADKEEKKLSESLEKIGDRTQRMLDSMSDIIWSVKPDNDSLPKILARMREYASSMLEAKNIDYTIDFPEEEEKGIRLPLELKNNMYLIFKEAINNLAKYSQCTEVKISFAITDKKVFMLIKDNGIGFDTSLPDTGNGLANMKRRAEEVGAEITIKSENSKGTQIHFNKSI